MAATASVPAVPAPAGRSRWIRLIPVAIIVYIISFMDRTNIGFAFDGMGKDLHLDSAAQGLAGGIFFIGYLALQIPGGHLAERWSAKKFVGIMVLIWGVFAVVSGLVQNFTQLLIVRFLLGVAEGGIWPANALGNLGGFAGPYVGGWLQDASGGSFLSTAVVLAVALLLGGLVMITLRRQADKPTVAPPAVPVRDTAGRAPAG